MGQGKPRKKEIAMKATKVREMFMGLVAIVIIVVVAALASAVFGWNIPILRDIAGALGMGG
ncbi:MAG: hypothetical protein RLZZ303_1670 [Candidatus Hydrogenedentota bacterium]|jgi:small-conductance mechanosensitive channel